MRFRILGPLELQSLDGPIELGGRRRRALAAYLLYHHNRPLPLDRIIDDLWEEEFVEGAAGTVQTYISQLRKLLPDVNIVKEPAGYVLRLPEVATLDSARFEQLASDLAALTSAADRVRTAEEALALFQSQPLQEFAGSAWADAAATSLTASRLNVVERYVESMFACERHAEVLPLLESTVAAHALDERFWGQLMLGLYRSGRQSEALRAFATLRRELATELGIEPGPELCVLERQIIDHDPSLRLSQTAHASQARGGVVTFLMTDLVDSTKLWDTQPAEMSRALARHEELVEATISKHNGTLIKHRGEGDSTLSVFERASDSVRAAVALLEDMSAEAWAIEPALHMRIAIHTGEAEHRDGDYFGGTLNRAARLRALAAPDEILCSRATADLVIDSLSDDVRLVERGSHELKGLRRPEVVYAVTTGDIAPVPASASLAFRILGEPTFEGSTLASPQSAILLVRFLVDRNHTVSEDELADAIWGSNAPVTARNSLQSKVSRLRALLGTNRIVRVAGGYRLVVEPSDLDADRFDELVALARTAASPGAALGHLDEALALWEGPAYGSFAERDVARAEAARLEALRRSAEDLHLELAMDTYAPHEVLAESERLLERDPFRESAWALRARLLAATGRRVEALRSLHAYRHRLADETGLTPSSALADVERSLLDGETPAIRPRERVIAGAAIRRGAIPWSGPITPSHKLVGRERELEMLEASLADAVVGNSRFVLVSGDAGVGKTRVLTEICERARLRDFVVVRGSGLPTESRPLSALRTALAHIGHEIDVQVAGAGSGLKSETIERRRGDEAIAVADAIADAASSKALLLAIDDLHEVDDLSLAVLDVLLTTCLERGGLHLLLIATYRSVGVAEDVLARIDRMKRLPNASEIRLSGVDEVALVELVTQATSHRPTPRLVDALADASGNPLISVALLSSFADAGALVVRDSRLDLGASAPTAVPYDVRSLLSSYLRELDRATESALMRIALLGNGQDIDTIALALGHDEARLIDLLQRGEDAGLISIEDDRVVFTHDLIRWALTGAVGGVMRRRMHHELAVGVAGDTDPTDPDRVRLLAEQLRLSGDRSVDARVGYWSEIAGDLCLDRALWSDAVKNYESAVEATDTPDSRHGELELKAGIACFHHHDSLRARDHLVEALECAEPRTTDFGTAAFYLYRTALTLTADAELLEHAERALTTYVQETAGNASPDVARLRARALALMTEAVWSTRDRSTTSRMAEALREATNRVNDDEVRSRAEMALGLLDLAVLRVSDARDHFTCSADLSEVAGDPLYETTALGRVAFGLILAGELGRAWALLSRVRERQFSLRFWSELSFTEMLAATVELIRGHPVDALSRARDSIRYFERSGYQFVPNLAYPALAAAHVELGEFPNALATIEEWRAVVSGGQTVYEAAILAASGSRAAAMERLAGSAIRVVPLREIDLLNLPAVAVAARLALALNAHEVLDRMFTEIEGLIEHGVLAAVGWPTFLPSLAAEIAYALDHADAKQRLSHAEGALRQLRQR